MIAMVNSPVDALDDENAGRNGYQKALTFIKQEK